MLRKYTPMKLLGSLTAFYRLQWGHFQPGGGSYSSRFFIMYLKLLHLRNSKQHWCCDRSQEAIRRISQQARFELNGQSRRAGLEAHPPHQTIELSGHGLRGKALCEDSCCSLDFPSHGSLLGLCS
eukprot:4279110-Amphidinium_carterae.1